jgi:tellurite resistance protein
MNDQTTDEARLKFLPISFFAMVMGLTGLSIAWQKAEITYDLQLRMSGAWLALAAISFLILLALYLYKLFRHLDAVRKELAHPVQLNFFPTLSISLILLGTATLHQWPAIAGTLWLIGTTLHLLFTLYVMSVWIHHEHFEIHHINPAWFIPVVGNALVPIAGVPLGFMELSWFFFSIGMLFWLVLLAIIMYRVLFHQPLPSRLMPTFFILIAPPAVGFLSYVQLTGTIDAFARFLYYSGLFLTLLLATQVTRFARIEFYLSWWAYSFPLAAITIASLVMYERTGLVTFAAIGWALLSFVTLVVVYLLYRTALAVSGRKICVPSV